MNIEYEVDKEGGVTIIKYDPYELQTQVICLPPSLAVIVAMDVLASGKKWARNE